MTKLPVATFPISLGGDVIAVVVISAEIEIDVAVVHPPVPQVITSVTFTRGTDMAALRGNPQLQPFDPALNITSSPVEVIITPAGGSPQPAITLDMINPAATFDCNDGDGYSVRGLGAVNAAGTGPPGNPFTGTASVGGGGNVPPPQVITGVNFVTV